MRETGRQGTERRSICPCYPDGMMSSTPEALLRQGYQARREDRLADAKTRFTEAVDLCRTADDKAMLAQALTGLGQIERDLRETDAALRHYEDAVAIYRTLDDPLVLAHTVRHVGDILQNQGKLESAAPCFVEALEIYRRHEETPALDLANALRGYALLKASTGDKEEAKRFWQEAGVLYAAAGVKAGVAESERQVARLTA
jgi:tetratricopeptide (TPR) repeat protein